MSKVAGPAILMQVYGALLLVGGIVLAVLSPFISAELGPNDKPVVLAMLGVCIVVCLALGALIFWAAMRMKALRSYALAMSAVVVIFLVGFLACLPAMVVGIWPLVVLLDGEVKACFDRPEAPMFP